MELTKVFKPLGMARFLVIRLCTSSISSLFHIQVRRDPIFASIYSTISVEDGLFSDRMPEFEYSLEMYCSPSINSMTTVE